MPSLVNTLLRWFGEHRFRPARDGYSDALAAKSRVLGGGLGQPGRFGCVAAQGGEAESVRGVAPQALVTGGSGGSGGGQGDLSYGQITQAFCSRALLASGKKEERNEY